MFPFHIDAIPTHDASTTLIKEQTEFRIHAIPSYFDQDLVKLNNYISGELISVYTNLSLSKQPQQFKLQFENNTSTMDDDFDVISQFAFKNSKKIKARLKKVTFSHPIIID